MKTKHKDNHNSPFGHHFFVGTFSLQVSETYYDFLLSVTGLWSQSPGKYLSGYSSGTAKYGNLGAATAECNERSG